MTSIMARSTFSGWEGPGRRAGVRGGRMGARPRPPPRKRPHRVGGGAGGCGEADGEGPGTGVAAGPRSSEPCLWLWRFDLRPGKPGRSGPAAAKPRSQEPVERAGLRHPPAPPTRTPHSPPPVAESEPAWLPGIPTSTPLGAVLCWSALGSGLGAPSRDNSKLAKCPARLVCKDRVCYTYCKRNQVIF